MNAPPVPPAVEDAIRLPAPGDNVAIATRRLEAGSVVRHERTGLTLPHTVLEGHRLVVEPIASGQPLLSWGLPFGTALYDLWPGEYVCNERILGALASRGIDFELPSAPNFIDRLERYAFDEASFEPGRQVEPVAAPGTFAGFRRPGSRGVGTRNFVIVLATTSRANALASALATRLDGCTQEYPNIDGVVAVTHTEGAADPAPNNLAFVLRTLAGFVVHANVGAVLVLDYPGAGYGNADLRDFMTGQGYPLQDVPHRFHAVEGDFTSELERAEGVIREWLPAVNHTERTDEPLSELKVALQCGGSDAFSGVSGNALAGWVAKSLLSHGGSANLAETPELIGAEAYVLRNVRDAETAKRFLDRVEAFKERVRHHGATAEGNPSGGNNYRGLYNIALKSIGAARKLDPEVRLDHVIDYGAPMAEPGYYFMDSPGNDLESIAGQVASGCNLIFFTTGNGSITNFPFVPTLKFVTTTGRFQMLAHEMDVNAGRYNDGESMAALGEETFELARRVAAGERSKGERAGHAQVQLWRAWQQVDDREIEHVRAAAVPDGKPLPTLPAPPASLRFRALKGDAGLAADQVALVMPTSLCSGQVARLIAERLNAGTLVGGPVTRYVALVHTEGCGSVNADELYLQTLLGHLRHPFVRRGLLLEHGCERIHNDAVRHYLADHGVALGQFGWASVQLDGGIESVTARASAWFDSSLRGEGPLPEVLVGADDLSVGLVADGELPELAAQALAAFAGGLVAAGGTVVVPSTGALADSARFRDTLIASSTGWRTTLAYGQPVEQPGLHVMDAPTVHPTEVITGLGGTGAQVMVGHVGASPLQSHPMIPLIQVSGTATVRARFANDLDLEFVTHAGTAPLVLALEQRVGAVASRRYTPRLAAAGVTGFQLTRGRLGISV